MKKLLVLAFMVFFATGAFAQIAYFNAGTVDASLLTVSPGKWVEVPVWFTGTFPPVAIENMNFPLGCKVAYLDTLTGGAMFFPITAWDDASFPPGTYNDDTHPIFPNPPGYISLAFKGYARPVHTDSPLLYGTGVPIKIFTFMVHTEDTVAVDQTFTDLLIAGVHPTEGVMNAGDSTGEGGFDVDFTGCPIYFSPNQPPEIDPDSVFTMPYDCGYTDFSVYVDIFDNDGDDLDVTTNYGTVTLFATDGGAGEPTTYTYKIDFDMEDFCGDCASFFLTITADDGVNDPVVYTYADEVTIVGVITASMHDLWVLPGEEDWMNVYLNACGDCFCLGGFVFSIEFDPSIISVTDVERGAAIMSGEYWNVVYNFDGPGTIRVVFINDLNDQIPAREICNIDPQDWLFRIKFLLSAEYEYPSEFCNPICFMYDTDGENHWDYNNVSDAGGYHIWINDGCDDAPDSIQYGTFELDMFCGNLKVVDCNVVRGDINLNGHCYEVGDAVLLANHIMDPVAYPFSLRQMIAADANQDGLRATVGDLIYIINMLNGVGGGKVAPLDVVATIAMPADASGNVDVTVSSEVSVGGAVVSINHTGVELGVPTIDGMNIDYSDNGDVMTVLVYNMDSHSFTPGTNVLFTVPMLSEGTISFGEVSVSDNRGALLDGRVSYEAALPTEFAVSQNYPNPFNAKTSFRLEVPTTSDITINVYNVAGQLVKAMNMHLDAGVHSVVWDASDVASGVYFYKVTADDFTKTMKMTLLK
jgi:hypothetical protein